MHINRISLFWRRYKFLSDKEKTCALWICLIKTNFTTTKLPIMLFIAASYKKKETKEALDESVECWESIWTLRTRDPARTNAVNEGRKRKFPITMGTTKRKCLHDLIPALSDANLTQPNRSHWRSLSWSGMTCTRRSLAEWQYEWYMKLYTLASGCEPVWPSGKALGW